MTTDVRVPTVPYIAGRRGALAQEVAKLACRSNGGDYDRMTTSAREVLIEGANALIAAWIDTGVLVEYLGEYREREK